MSDRSAIEWTDSSWNPIRARNLKTGKIGWHCEHATTGCEFCYAEGINKRLGTGLPFKPGHRADIEIFLDEKMLLAPLKWKRPRRIFVGSMTDLFADFVTDEMLDRIFAVMALCPQHTFQVLTKRAERMRDYFAGSSEFRTEIEDRAESISIAAMMLESHLPVVSTGWTFGNFVRAALDCNELFPLPNVWLGVSCERQEEADERIPLLLQTPAAVRFISAEPLLGAIDLGNLPSVSGIGRYLDALHNGGAEFSDVPGKLDWIIVGGESGDNARPMHPDWARSLRIQCQAAGVAFFFKQWGEWLPGESNHGQFDPVPIHAYRRCDNHSYEWPGGRHQVQNFGTHDDPWSGDLTTRRVGKKAAGRLLDGREWNEFPTAAASDHQSGSRAELVP